jgi:hypothetical protein
MGDGAVSKTSLAANAFLAGPLEQVVQADDRAVLPLLVLPMLLLLLPHRLPATARALPPGSSRA